MNSVAVISKFWWQFKKYKFPIKSNAVIPKIKRKFFECYKPSMFFGSAVISVCRYIRGTTVPEFIKFLLDENMGSYIPKLYQKFNAQEFAELIRDFKINIWTWLFQFVDFRHFLRFFRPPNFCISTLTLKLSENVLCANTHFLTPKICQTFFYLGR